MSAVAVEREAVFARPGSRLSHEDARVALEELRRLGASRPIHELDTQEIVDAARPEASPLHRFFEWNDAAAAEAHRRQQAGILINSIVVRREEIEYPAFVNVPRKVILADREPEEGSPLNPYVPTETALADDRMAEHVLGQARREMKTFREKYERYMKMHTSFHSLQLVFDAMRQVAEETAEDGTAK